MAQKLIKLAVLGLSINIGTVFAQDVGALVEDAGSLVEDVGTKAANKVEALAGNVENTLTQGTSGQTYPASTDGIEEILYQLFGYDSLGLIDPATPCEREDVPGRNNAAMFVRATFHDCGLHDADTGSGGCDASMALELFDEHGFPDRHQNAGPSLASVARYLSRYVTRERSLADTLIASFSAVVQGCGGPKVNVAGGRIDATTYNNALLPEVKDPVEKHIEKFKRMGFSIQEMIQLNACGHAFGYFHQQQNPGYDIIFKNSKDSGALSARDNSNPNPLLRDDIPLDRTPGRFDNEGPINYVRGDYDGALMGRATLHSDKIVYEADKNVTITELMDPDVFNGTCGTVYQKLVELVPNGVQLSPTIEPYPVKPINLGLTLGGNGTSLSLTGRVRVITSGSETVELVYKDRSGSNGGTASTTLLGSGSSHDVRFNFYGINANISTLTGISSFDVKVDSSNYNNNGKSFSISDVAFVQIPESGKEVVGGGVVAHITAAVRSTNAEVSAKVSYQTFLGPRTFMPKITHETVSLQSTGVKLGEYSLYTGEIKLSETEYSSAIYDLEAVVDGQTITQIRQRFTDFPPWKGSVGGGDNPPTSGGPGNWNGTKPGNGVGDTPKGPDGGLGGWLDYVYPEEPADSKPCGSEEGCDPLDWATKTDNPSKPTGGSGSGRPGSSWPHNGNNGGNGGGHGGSWPGSGSDSEGGAHGGYHHGEGYENGWNGGYGGSEHSGHGGHEGGSTGGNNGGWGDNDGVHVASKAITRTVTVKGGSQCKPTKAPIDWKH